MAVSLSYGGTSATVSWNGAPKTQSDNGKSYPLDIMTISVTGTVNGSSYSYVTTVGGSTSGSWTLGFGLGENLSLTFAVSGQYGYYSGPNLVYGLGAASGSWYTGSPPPPPPLPPSPGSLSGLADTDNNTNVVLNWNALVGGSGYTVYYNVYRSIGSGSEQYLGNTTGTGYTDSNPGTTRPITYRVQPYSSGNGSQYAGTTYGVDETVVAVVPMQWSLWDGTQEITDVGVTVWDGVKEVSNLGTTTS